MKGMSDFVSVRNLRDGSVDRRFPAKFLTHPVFGKYLEVAEPDAKPRRSVPAVVVPVVEEDLDVFVDEYVDVVKEDV